MKVTDDADRDITEAARWYAEHSPQVALNFVEEVMSCMQVIALFPNGAPRVRGLFRQLPVHGFPFVVLYRPMRDRIIVVRVFHTSLRPGRKFKRR